MIEDLDIPEASSFGNNILEPEMHAKVAGMIRKTPPPLHPNSGMVPRPQPINQSQESGSTEPFQNMSPIFDPVYDISCIQISNHIRDCPICSRLYQSDKTIYLLTIFFLLAVCLLLIKKILDSSQ